MVLGSSWSSNDSSNRKVLTLRETGDKLPVCLLNQIAFKLPQLAERETSFLVCLLNEIDLKLPQLAATEGKILGLSHSLD